MAKKPIYSVDEHRTLEYLVVDIGDKGLREVIAHFNKRERAEEYEEFLRKQQDKRSPNMRRYKVYFDQVNQTFYEVCAQNQENAEKKAKTMWRQDNRHPEPSYVESETCNAPTEA